MVTRVPRCRTPSNGGEQLGSKWSNMLGDTLGPAQTAALLVRLQKGFEQLYSKHYTQRQLIHGSRKGDGTSALPSRARIL